MRVDRSSFPAPALVWHVPTCRELRRVVWVSDDPPQYAQHVEPLQVVDGQLLERVVDCKRVVINAAACMVLIDPVDDAESEQAPRLAFEFIYSTEEARDAT